MREECPVLGNVSLAIQRLIMDLTVGRRQGSSIRDSDEVSFESHSLAFLAESIGAYSRNITYNSRRTSNSASQQESGVHPSA